MQSQTPSYVLTTLLTRPSSSDLTSLATAKDELGIPTTDTANDGTIGRYIKEASSAIARYCNRIFGLATWQDEFRPQHAVRGEGTRGAYNPLMLRRWPLASGAVAFTGNTHASKLIDGIASTTGLEIGQPVFGTQIPAGATIAAVTPLSILLSANALSAQAAAALTAGMSVVETVAGVSTQLVAGTDFQIDMGSRLPGDEGSAGLYRLNDLGHPRTWPAAQIVIVYQSGYRLPCDPPGCGSCLPQDIETACLRIVTMRFKARGRDPALVEQSQTGGVGMQRWWVGAQPNQSGSLPPEIAHMVEPYRVPVLA